MRLSAIEAKRARLCQLLDSVDKEVLAAASDTEAHDREVAPSRSQGIWTPVGTSDRRVHPGYDDPRAAL